MPKKRKVLALLDSPTVSTGFAQVAKNVLKQIHNTGLYDITVLGINHTGSWYDQEKYPYKIYPAMPYGFTDMFGRGRLFQTLQGLDREIKPPFDIVFTLQDHFLLYGSDDASRGFNVSKKLKQLQYEILTNEKVSLDNLFNWVGYYPVDGKLQSPWVQEGIAMCDYPVAYTVFGAKEILKFDTKEINLKERLNIIPHGVNIKDFYPISEEEKYKFRKEYFGGHVKDDHFLVVNISRNQPRKDIPRTLKIFAEYLKINPKAFLYIHAKADDVGGNIWTIADQLGLELDKHFALTNPDFNAMYGVTLDTLNKIYGAADVLLTTTLGEGWGFINTEAMAVKRPIIAPANTAIPEIFGMEDISEKEVGIDYVEKNLDTLRGIPIKSGYGKGDFLVYGLTDNSVVRPLTDIDDGVAKLDWVFKNPDKVKKIVENGYEYSQTLSWDSEMVGERWIKLFDIAYKNVEKARKEGHIKEKSKAKEKATRIKNRKKRKNK